jgi:hypothetical protein
MGIGTWGWGTSCGGLVTSWGWGYCPCPTFIPGLDVDDCGVSVRTCVAARLRPGELAARLRPGELAMRARPADIASRSVGEIGSRARPADIPSRSRICED